MANDKHLAILKKGVSGWNEWRKSNTNVKPDLSYIDLNGIDLFGTDLSETNLSGATLCGTILTEDGITEATSKTAQQQKKAMLSKAILTGADLHDMDLVRADFTGSELRQANLDGADLTEANFTEANLGEAFINKANLTRANLYKANLVRANIIGSTIKYANLHKANLCEADLSSTSISGAFLPGVNLHDANLSEADLNRVDLSEADLVGACLIDTNLNDSILRGVNLKNTTINGTIFGNTDLKNAKGLNSCCHDGPCTIDHRTLVRSENLPLKFLRGCGLPDNLIDYLPSLLDQPIQFYSCFISYSSEDDEFARRLHADLQNEGVRCWYAPKDMRIAAKIRTQLDKVIRIYDKLLLVLSGNSLDSTWVEKEVETAFEKESERHDIVIFPIRLDDKIFRIKTGWAGDIKRSRNIGDFRQWRDHTQYKEAFNRLLRDLKPSLEKKIK